MLYGKQIITDEWARDSFGKGHLQDVNGYLARDPEREREWGVDLSEAIRRGKNNVKPLAGHDIYFTGNAKKELGALGYSELKEIALLAGSNAVRVGSSIQKIAIDIKMRKRQGEEDDPVIVIIALSLSQNHGEKEKDKEKDKDNDLDDLTNIRCYSKDIITLSALRGVLDTKSDEFVISGSKKGA